MAAFDLPEVFYHTASLEPVNNPKLIWFCVVPSFLGSVAVFWKSLVYYGQQQTTVTRITIAWEPTSAATTCSMLETHSSCTQLPCFYEAVFVEKPERNGPDGIDVWAL